MCEGFWDRRTGRWVNLEMEEDEELETLTDVTISLPPPAVEPRRKPTPLVR